MLLFQDQGLRGYGMWKDFYILGVWMDACGGVGVLSTTISLSEDYSIGLFFGRTKYESTCGLSLRSWWCRSIHASYKDSPFVLYSMFILLEILDCSSSCTIIHCRSHCLSYDLKLSTIRIC